ncbi:MAG: recombinase RecT [Pseudomonadota bacterium]|nr:recombinase RecT [Pseudomonadota bacterium]
MNAITTTERQPRSVLVDMSSRFGMEPGAFEATVRATCMKPDKNGKVPSREEFAAFLLVAKEYNLNPLTKEIYAFPAKGGGIVPIVSIDGWVNLINSHKALDGIQFDMEHDDKGLLISCTCKIHRKDRSHPVEVTEYLVECKRNTEPWQMQHRMLRHKALIQCARYAFGFSGIYDEDEGAKIAETRDVTPPTPPKPPAPPMQQITQSETIDAETGEVIEDSQIVRETGEDIGAVMADGEFDAAAFFEEMETSFAAENSVEGVEERWTEFDPMAQFEGDESNQGIALAIKKRRLREIERVSNEQE